MLATEDFKLRMIPERKRMLDFLASREGRSKAKMIDRLILKEYQIVTGQQVADPKPAQEHEPAAVA